MLYVLHGDDNKTLRSKLSEMTAALLKRQPDASIYKITADNFSPAHISELLRSQGLFLPKYIIVFDILSDDKEKFGEMLKMAHEMKAAEHVSIIVERELNEKNKIYLEEIAQKVQNFPKAAEKKRFDPPTFAFTDAFARRDFLSALKSFEELRKQEIAAEEIHGTLWWQMKSIKLSADSASAVGAGLSPFVFKKSKEASAKWKPAELTNVLEELFEMYHRAHRGQIDFYTGLEQAVLKWGK